MTTAAKAIGKTARSPSPEFEGDDDDGDDGARDRRLLRQRQASDVVSRLVRGARRQRDSRMTEPALPKFQIVRNGDTASVDVDWSKASRAVQKGIAEALNARNVAFLLGAGCSSLRSATSDWSSRRCSRSPRIL